MTISLWLVRAGIAAIRCTEVVRDGYNPESEKLASACRRRRATEVRYRGGGPYAGWVYKLSTSVGAQKTVPPRFE